MFRRYTVEKVVAMPPKKGDPEQTVCEKILVEASRIYDARDGEEDSKDLKSYAEFLSRQDAFYKVPFLSTEDVRVGFVCGCLVSCVGGLRCVVEG